MDKNYIKKSTFFITITLLTIIFIISIIFIAKYYKSHSINVNIPTIVEDNSIVDNSLSDISIN